MISGTVAECQQERSQIKNKETAMKLLRAKLYSARLEEETSRRYQARKLQVQALNSLFTFHFSFIQLFSRGVATLASPVCLFWDENQKTLGLIH